MELFFKKKTLSSFQIIIFGFLAVILVGTLLLMLPFASREPGSAPFLDALFTATSATCVTGLIVHDTATYWSCFGQVVILLLINIVLLIVGIFMDMTPAVLIFTPIFLPIAEDLGMNPVHFGIMMVANLCIGLLTPPVGSALFVGCSISGVKIQQLIKPLLPFYAALLIALMMIVYIPQISLFIPQLLGLM